MVTSANVPVADERGAGTSEHHPAESVEINRLRAQRRQKVIADEDTSEIDRSIRVLGRQALEGPPVESLEVLAERYEMLDRVGTGTYATVWKAYDRVGESLVAVKVLHGHWNTDRSKIERFETGAKKMCSLRHPAIVPVIAGPEHSRHHRYYVMKLYSGGDLHRAVIERTLSRERALAALADALDGLAYAHERGIVHRDVKPSNILLDERSAGAITDFDLAQAKDTQYWTQTATGLGAYAYAAPEQQEDASTVDQRADVFAAGMCALFVLRSRVPKPYEFHMRSVAFEDLECSKGLAEAVAHAVAHDPADRSPTCSDLAKAIRAEISS
jgi:serine/threonine protein kinase